MDTSAYFDKRSDFFKAYYEKALEFEDYLSSGSNSQQSRWNNIAQSLELTSQQQELLNSFTRKMNILVMSGIWCGDCARQGPMLHHISLASSLIEVRFIDNKDNPELKDELRILGAERVPVVLTLSEDFFEIGRFGDRHLSVYRNKAERELEPACEFGNLAPPLQELQEELNEWIGFFERQQLMLRLSPMLRQRYGD